MYKYIKRFAKNHVHSILKKKKMLISSLQLPQKRLLETWVGQTIAQKCEIEQQ